MNDERPSSPDSAGTREDARWRALVLASAQIVWTADPEGHVLDDSPTWRAFTGQTYDEWRGSGWLDAVHPDDREHAARMWRDAVERRAMYEAEYRVRRADGAYRWTAARGVPIVGTDGRIVEWVGANTDVEAARRAAAAIAETARQRDALLDLQRALSAAGEATRAEGATRAAGNLAGGDAAAVADEPARVAVLAAAVERVLPVVPRAQGSVIEMLERDGANGVDHLVYRAAAGSLAHTVGVRVLRAASLSGLAVDEGRTLVCADSEADDRVDREACRRVGVRSLIVVPIPRAGTPGNVFAGVLKLAHARPHAFEESDVLAAQLAVGAIATGLSGVAEARATAALRESEAFHRFAAEAGRAGSWYVRLDTMECVLSPMMGELMGFPPGQTTATAAQWREAVVPEDRAALDAAMSHAVARGVPFRTEFRVRLPDGSARWLYSNGGTVRDGAGRPTRLHGASVDVTERKRAEAELRDSEARFRELADAMPQIVWAAGPDGTLDYYNRRWFEYVGASPDAPEPPRWDRFVHPDDLPGCVAAWSAAVADGSPYNIEFRVRGGDEQYRWFLVRALPIRDDAGAITRWFGTCTDIQELRTLQAQKERALESAQAAREQAEQASQMKDEFLATLSHELRTPLTAILGWAQILRRSAARQNADPPALIDGLATIERNARAQTKIVEDLLDMSRIISGKVHLDARPADLAVAIRAAIDTVQPAALAKCIQIVFDAPRDARYPILGDAGRLQQVFWNLLSNAIKFTPRNGTVHVAVGQRHSQWQADVVDSGEGIAPEFLPYVFDRFRQADASTTRRHGGLGLGLAIVKQLVELHGGKARVRSDGVGRGATFTVSLPVRIVHDEPAPGGGARSDGGAAEGVSTDGAAAEGAQAESTDTAAGAGDAGHSGSAAGEDALRGVRVLVVDDEPDARSLLARLLGDSGAQVLVAANAEQAVATLQRERPDVLVSDIGMPGEDGYRLIRRVRALDTARGGAVPAIALTAYARAEDRAKAIGSGFALHVAKPVEPAELVHAVALLANASRGVVDGGSAVAAESGCVPGADRLNLPAAPAPPRR